MESHSKTAQSTLTFPSWEILLLKIVPFEKNSIKSCKVARGWLAKEGQFPEAQRVMHIKSWLGLSKH